MSTTVTWPVFQAVLMGREMVAERTMSSRFAKRANWSYRAGQFVDIIMLEPPETDSEGWPWASTRRNLDRGVHGPLSRVKGVTDADDS